LRLSHPLWQSPTYGNEYDAVFQKIIVVNAEEIAQK